MRSRRTIAAALAAANVRSSRPSDWLCAHAMGQGYSSRANTKLELSLRKPD
jgi:hypothetical protein